MSKFKTGDRVRRKDGTCFSNGDLEVTVRCLEETKVWLQESDSWTLGNHLKLVEDTSAYHVHHDLVIAWAKGAEIEYYSEHYVGWKLVTETYQTWHKDVRYRIKPTPPKTDKERIAELEARVAELESTGVN
tara:strand:- start:43 stop:435 length:393 start_codon:yes stop_codon:yes gene_type:complete